MPSSSQLELRNLRFAYEAAGWFLDVPALAFGCEPLCGIVGPNGSGKSTLLKIAAGLLVPQAGEAVLAGRSLASRRRRALARQLGYLPQECPVLFDYGVEQVVAMGRHPYGGTLDLSGPGDRAAVARALGEVGLESLCHRPMSQLSGGERRRAWLAAALAQETELLLLDEPTAALDPHQAVAVMAILAQRAAAGLRVVAVMHDLNLAALYCDRLVLLRGGTIAADGPSREILTEERLRTAYGTHIEVLSHPQRRDPVVLPKK